MSISPSEQDRPVLSFLRGSRRGRRVLLLLLLGLLLLLLSTVLSSREEEAQEVSLQTYRAELEGQVATLCTSVEGVGRCQVMITFSAGEQVTYRGTVRTGSTPPQVDGVCVVCDGGDSVRVRSELSGVIAALFGIGENRIHVSKMS